MFRKRKKDKQNKVHNQENTQTSISVQYVIEHEKIMKENQELKKHNEELIKEKMQLVEEKEKLRNGVTSDDDGIEIIIDIV